jgi:hypothetical protein
MNTKFTIDLVFWHKFAQFWSPADLVKEGRGKELFIPIKGNIDRKIIMDEQDVIAETGDLDEELKLL